MINNIFLKLGIFSLDNEFSLDTVNPRTAALVRKGPESKIEFSAIKSFGKHTNNFRMRLSGKYLDFEGLPYAGLEDSTKKSIIAIDDKWTVKEKLKKNNLPIAPGQSFWWFQKRKAIKFARDLGFPLVVKPRIGSLSQHVYLGLKNFNSLNNAIKKVAEYSPAFIVEKFLVDAELFRITVVNRDKAFVAKRSSPKVIGNGIGSIRELAMSIGFNSSNLDDLASENGFDPNRIPRKNEEVTLSKKIILSLGAEVKPIKTENIHQDNLEIFKRVAELFKTKLLGIDFLARDIGKSWRNQEAAVIEVNSLPNIQMHSYKDKKGGEQNEVADAIINTVLKHHS